MDDEISSEEVESLLDEADQPRIIDIRSPTEFARGHIPGSENVPFNELPDRIDEFTDSDHIVTVCPHGKASVQAARLIGSYEGTAAARVESMAGGLEAWTGDLDADETDDHETPDSPF
ncbi:rhodanese-like domain-containing protein [Haloplanus sp.]|uniref:rhodanese-like domain-containing protein n=1 Tax=Haloplanus sp. TaxID=1961696 RepID=UPI00260946C4|nr:rhodanese-like domain-containing protein [Haloplanus sp.]